MNDLVKVWRDRYEQQRQAVKQREARIAELQVELEQERRRGDERELNQRRDKLWGQLREDLMNTAGPPAMFDHVQIDRIRDLLGL